MMEELISTTQKLTKGYETLQKIDKVEVATQRTGVAKRQSEHVPLPEGYEGEMHYTSAGIICHAEQARRTGSAA